jgi:hypothetical protein
LKEYHMTATTNASHRTTELEHFLTTKDAAATSPANRTLESLVDVLRAAVDLAEEWIDSGHGSGCSCNFCSYQTEIGQIARDVAGAAWATETLHAALMGAPVGTSDEFTAMIAEMKRERDSERAATAQGGGKP